MFWLSNPKVLLESKIIFPNRGMRYEDKLNAIARFSLIFMVLIYLLNGDMRWMSFSATLLILTVILNKNNERFSEDSCEAVNINNPYGNFRMGDYYGNINKLPVCETSIETSEETALESFNGILTEDYYKRNINFRDFYTMPVTTVVNDQSEFAKFLLGESGECKHDGNNCLKNEDVKFHRGRYFDGNSV
jgi:hypothetical protein